MSLNSDFFKRASTLPQEDGISGAQGTSKGGKWFPFGGKLVPK
jgi:hypothetical protein